MPRGRCALAGAYPLPRPRVIVKIREPIDIVDVFRPSADVADHVADMLAMSPRPKVVWLQLGITNAAAAARLVAGGIDVIQDRCALADHRRFGL